MKQATDLELFGEYLGQLERIRDGLPTRLGSARLYVEDLRGYCTVIECVLAELERRAKAQGKPWHLLEWEFADYSGSCSR